LDFYINLAMVYYKGDINNNFMDKNTSSFTLYTSLIFIVLLSLAPTLVIAETGGTCECGGDKYSVVDKAACDDQASALGISCAFTPFDSGSTGGSGNTGSRGGTTVIENPLGQDDPRIIIGNIIRVVLGIVGSLALIIFIYGGLMWMTSSGNAERIKKGRDTLVWAAIGLMVIFGSYTVVNFVIQSITKPPTGG